MPELKPGFPTGNRSISSIDKDGNLWFGMMYQGAIAKFDPKTEKFQIFRLPPERNRDDIPAQHGDARGSTSTARSGPTTPAHRPSYGSISTTGKYEKFDPLATMPGGRAGHIDLRHRAPIRRTTSIMTEYPEATTSCGIDAKTGKVTFYQAPTPLSRNRRGRMDDAGSLLVRANTAATRSGCSTPGRRSSRNGRCRPSSPSPMTSISDKNGELLDRRHDHRPRGAARSQDRPGDRISAAARHQHAPHVRRQLDHAGRPSGSAATTAPRS